MQSTDTVRSNDTEIRVWRGGAGAPLLFLSDANIGAAWLPFHDRLAERFDVILPEHPGYGGGDAPAWLDRVADLANFYLDLLAQLELSRVHLVGAALGGWIAAELATRNTARLASLTLIDPWGLRVDGVTGIDPFASTDEQTLRDLFADAKTADLQVARILAPEGEDALLKGKMITAKLAWQPRLHDPHLTKWLHRIDVPTLIGWGEQDKLLPRAYGAAWRAAVPGARLVTISGAGHLPHAEKPDESAGMITDFIAQQRAAT
ncbi:MAG TPA: alpha/beta fold hydrolase [Stellaceae bacterium]|jgi:pimeloyl-ACP methyl ester carboxylesterase|nr:alpha/beta fold hydrolase [Stellaceae bacterium]